MVLRVNDLVSFIHSFIHSEITDVLPSVNFHGRCQQRRKESDITAVPYNVNVLLSNRHWSNQSRIVVVTTALLCPAP